MDESPQIEITYIPTGQEGHAVVTAHLPDGTHTDSFKAVSAKARAKFADAVVERVPAVDRATIITALDGIAAAIAGNLARRTGSPAVAEAPNRDALLAAVPEKVRLGASDMLRDPYLIKRIVEDIELLGVAGERELTATTYLIGTSRLLHRTLAGIVQGPTASGKSFQIEVVASLFPEEEVVHATQMTPQALFHMPPGTLSHKFVVAGERTRVQSPETAEATRALREMLSSGRLSKLMPVREDGRIVTHLIKQDGPIAFVESTTITKVFEEDANRCVMLQTDERPEQTKRIYMAIAETYRGLRRQDVVDEAVMRHHAAQRMLERDLRVVIPYGPELARHIPSERVEGRRAFGHLLSGVAAVAFLHQLQRQRDEHGAVIATETDYQIAAHLLDRPLSQLLGRRVSAGSLRLRERLEHRFGSDQFSTRDACAGESVSDRHIRDWLLELHDGGYLDQVEPSRGSRPAVWKLLPVDPDDGAGANLPAINVVFPGADFRRSDNAQVPVRPGPSSEPAGTSGTVPTSPAPAPEPIRQSGPVPTNGLGTRTDLIVGMSEVPPGRAV